MALIQILVEVLAGATGAVTGSGGQQKNFEPVRQGWPSPRLSAPIVLKSFEHLAMQKGEVPAQ